MGSWVYIGLLNGRDLLLLEVGFARLVMGAAAFLLVIMEYDGWKVRSNVFAATLKNGAMSFCSALILGACPWSRLSISLDGYYDIFLSCFL
jgi:hypothetical protein